MVETKPSFLDYFEDLEDPRIERKKLYPMEEILLLTLCGMIAGCEGWADIEEFGKAKREFLKLYLPYKNGTPSDDTLRRFFRAVNPKSFQKKFVKWTESFGYSFQEEVIAIDGKTSRRSYDGDQSAMHLVSAFATEARLVLGQTKVSEKSNEITAIPELLEWLDVKGATVTIDAMGCQKKIAQLIYERGGNYVLGLKGNHRSLLDEAKTFFEGAFTWDEHETIDGEHGRIETRHCFVTQQIDWIRDKEKWAGLKSIVMVESKREVKGQKSTERRYYLSSLSEDAEKILKVIRSHWGIENSVHWVMDMSFGDDASRIRLGNAPENMAVIKHSALNMIRRYRNGRQTIKRLRKQAGWDNDVLHGILVCAS